MDFVASQRVTLEIIIGEVADVMERMRYDLLEDREPTSAGNATRYPKTYDYIHLSNIP